MSKSKYEIKIGPPNWDGYKYSVFYQKLYGDRGGGATEFKTKEELLDFLKAKIKRWSNDYDFGLDRMPDTVTPNNLAFTSFTPEITKMELFGYANLFCKERR